ncbi:hypothetical protein E9993_02595 [Labilibacter sediminis]|nr:hypothetical protein E9993_02595 [Labilibacter sediminis]
MMKKLFYKLTLLLMSILLFVAISTSQTKDGVRSTRSTKLFKRAMSLAEQENYKDAIEVFKIIVEHNPEDLDALFNMGLCYLNTTDGADTAVICFNKGLDILTTEEKQGYLGAELGLSLGKAYQVLLKPLKAIAIYEELIQYADSTNTAFMKELEREIQICHHANFFINNPIELTVENMGSGVNSMYDDHSPLIAVSESQLFFTSRRNWIKLSLLPDGQYAEKIYSVPLAANNWESARLLKVFFKQNEHEAAASLSPDGNDMVLFRNDEHGKSLYLSHFDGNSWSSPEKLPFPINSYAQETHGSISADKSTFFFTSDREGGLGGLDIYMSKKNKNGVWGEPKNLGPTINSEFDEETPMIHYDGKTLYFSSEGHNTMGRLDVFYSQMNEDSTWTRPVNMGYPINTPDDDFFFVPTINKSHAYYASSKFADNYGGSDIYHVKFNADANTELAVVEGMVSDEFGDDFENMRILVTRRKDNKLVGDYRPNAESGTYMMFLEIGYEYEVKETNDKDSAEVSFLNVTTEMSYLHHKKSVVFNDVAMDAPLRRIIQTELNNFTEFANNEILKEVNSANVTTKPVKSSSVVPVSQAVSKPVTSKSSKVVVAKPVVTERVTGVEKDIEKPKVKEVVAKYSSKQSSGYTLQLLALKKAPLKDYNFFKERGITGVVEYKCIDGFTRYTFGTFSGYKPSLQLKRKLIKEGKFKDIWIRPIKDFETLEIE